MKVENTNVQNLHETNAIAKLPVLRSAVKVSFNKLIGNHYPLEIKMEILNWILKTGRGQHIHQYGWYIDGINKSILGYSANNHDAPACLPKKFKELDMFFDAIFARAVFAPTNRPLMAWRQKESIFPDKYRMLTFNNGVPDGEQRGTYHLVYDIFKLEGKILKKEFHHPDYKERTEPKIICLSIFTTGIGWMVKYEFSFKEFNYEPGWTKDFHQSKHESICQFLKRSYDELVSLVADA